MNELLLLSGGDIPFAAGRATIHPPTLKEIAMIGEKMFFIGTSFLNFSKNVLIKSSDKTNLMDYDDFDIFMTLINLNDPNTKYHIDCAMNLLVLMFPLYEVEVRNDHIALNQNGAECGYINKNNFSEFKEILLDVFGLRNMKQGSNSTLNPKGAMAQKIANKLRARHEKLVQLAQQQGKDSDSVSILNRYASILAVGLQKDLNSIMNYTVYQLYDEFQRFQLKVQWDAYLQARMAGAKDLEEVDNWMIDLKDQKTEKKKK